MDRADAISFVSLGVGVTVESDNRVHVEWVESRLDALLAGHVEPLDRRPVEHVFSIQSGHDGTLSLLLNGEEIGTSPSAPLALHFLGTRIKLAVGGSTRTHVVVHAGVVGLAGRAVVLPAHSFQGKTTLVRELVRRGAVYYSDDLAIIDRRGLIHPFPKTLSLRGLAGDPYGQVEQTVESLGGVRGIDPLPAGLVLFTAFSHAAPAAQWLPQHVTPGHAVLKLVEHTLNVRAQPVMTMEVLGRVVRGASLLWESPRGEAGGVADQIVERMLFVASGSTVC